SRALFYARGAPRALPSFPTRRSSDLLSVEAMTFQALGEPSRLRIVELLRGGPFAVGDIAEVLGIRQPQVSKHLRVLAEAGIVIGDRKSTRLNSSHVKISYAVFCLKKK